MDIPEVKYQFRCIQDKIRRHDDWSETGIRSLLGYLSWRMDNIRETLKSINAMEAYESDEYSGSWHIIRKTENLFIAQRTALHSVTTGESLPIFCMGRYSGDVTNQQNWTLKRYADTWAAVVNWFNSVRRG